MFKIFNHTFTTCNHLIRINHVVILIIVLKKHHLNKSLVEIGPVVLEKTSFKFGQCSFTISLLSPLGKGAYKHKSPLLKDALEEITFRQCILAILLLSPIGKGRCLSFKNIQERFVPNLVEIGPVVLERKTKM